MQKTCSFQKHHIINNAVEFSSVFQTGKKYKTRYLTLYVKANQLHYPRLGLVVAKKAVRLAVKRNLIKRVIRESFRHNQESIIGFDIIIVVYHTVNTLDKQEFRKFLDAQWVKLITF